MLIADLVVLAPPSDYRAVEVDIGPAEPTNRAGQMAGFVREHDSQLALGAQLRCGRSHPGILIVGEDGSLHWPFLRVWHSLERVLLQQVSAGAINGVDRPIQNLRQEL